MSIFSPTLIRPVGLENVSTVSKGFVGNPLNSVAKVTTFCCLLSRFCNIGQRTSVMHVNLLTAVHAYLSASVPSSNAICEISHGFLLEKLLKNCRRLSTSQLLIINIILFRLLRLKINSENMTFWSRYNSMGMGLARLCAFRNKRVVRQAKIWKCSNVT